jgi:hypothetical protein
MFESMHWMVLHRPVELAGITGMWLFCERPGECATAPRFSTEGSFSLYCACKTNLRSAKSTHHDLKEVRMDNLLPTREQIEVRAYEIYLERGAQGGQDLTDWFAAEGELKELLEMAPEPKVSKAAA